MVKVNEILKITGGRVLSASADDLEIEPSRISTDSRTIKKDEFFLALKGENFDGASFVEAAFRKGASGAIVERAKPRLQRKGKTVIAVKDSTKALQDIAASHRSAFDIPVIAVTGSNGKTTVKDMIASLLSSKYRVLKNEGTKNNHIGVPQTLLELTPDHDICVLEFGINHKDEMGSLAMMARPSAAVITNIGPSHLEHFRNVESVFAAKSEVLDYIPDGGLGIINGDDPYLSTIKKGRLKLITFGLKRSNDFFATDISYQNDHIEFTLNARRPALKLGMIGVHNIYNALAAIAVASQFGVRGADMKRALEVQRPSRMRLNIKKTSYGVAVIDDSYNSNPLSASAAVEALRRYPAKSRWVVFGDMLELGKSGTDFHRLAGRGIAGSGATGLVTFGKLSRIALAEAKRCGMERKNLWHCATHGQIARILHKVVKKGDAILIKGSRGMKMEEVVKKLGA